MRPSAGEIDLALEILDTRDLRRLGRRETTGRHDVMATRYDGAVRCREPPALRGVIPCRRRNLGAKADIGPQPVAVCNEAEIAQDFRLGRVFLGPCPLSLQFRIEGVS